MFPAAYLYQEWAWELNERQGGGVGNTDMRLVRREEDNVAVSCKRIFKLKLKLKLSSPHAPLHETKVKIDSLFHQGRIVHNSA